MHAKIEQRDAPSATLSCGWRRSIWGRGGPHRLRVEIQQAIGGQILSSHRSVTRFAGLLVVASIALAACSSSGASSAPSTAASVAAPSAAASVAAPSAGASVAAGDPKTATSAADVGGVDAVCAAGKTEGQVNLIATPPDWANYGQMIKDFTAKYGIKVQSDQPDGDSAGEINAATRPRRHGPPAGHLRPRHRGRLGQHRQVRAVQGGWLGRHPRRQQGGDGSLDRTTTPASRASATTRAWVTSPRSPTSPIPSTRARSPSTATRSRPAQASTASSWPPSPTAARPTTSRPVSTSSRSSPSPGNLIPVDPAPATIALGHDTDRDRLDLQRGSADRGPGAQGNRTGRSSSRPTRRPSPPTTTLRSTRMPRIRRPRAAGWSTSSPMPARTPGSRAGAMPVRLAAMQTAGHRRPGGPGRSQRTDRGPGRADRWPRSRRQPSTSPTTGSSSPSSIRPK